MKKWRNFVVVQDRVVDPFNLDVIFCQPDAELCRVLSVK